MKDFILEHFTDLANISTTDMLLKLLIALAIGGVVYAVYFFSSPKVSYNGSFGLSLVAMTVITTAIMTVISSNIALSLGMVGALSIIRFRTAIKDPRDTMYIFWAIMVGICCGISQYSVAVAATAVLCLFFLIAGLIRDDKRYILIIRCAMETADRVKTIIYHHFPASRLSVQNTTQESAEFIYELKRGTHKDNAVFLREIYECGGVECVNFVLQEDTTNV